MNYSLLLQAFRQKYSGVKNSPLLFQYLREELQYLILYNIYTKTTTPLYFMGGTKLRLSYGINRFSEDLDFALSQPDPDFPAEAFCADLTKAFSEKITGFVVHVSLNTKRTVVKMMFSFSNLLFDLELSPLKDQTLKIKLEIDINPPSHAHHETVTYRSFVGDYMIRTYDLSTGFSGKIAAALNRGYQKGRDYYDLQWYLQHRPPIPMNLAYLNANCEQQQQKTFADEREVVEALKAKVTQLDRGLLRQDLERFVIMEPESFKQWLDHYVSETVGLLEAYSKNL